MGFICSVDKVRHFAGHDLGFNATIMLVAVIELMYL
jgi:hypothetical protein